MSPSPIIPPTGACATVCRPITSRDQAGQPDEQEEREGERAELEHDLATGR